MTKHDCYMIAFQHQEDTPDLILVHGYPINTGPRIGERFGHAWLEDSDGILIYDRKYILPRELYYRIGKIDELQCQRFTRIESLRQALTTKHYGPWGQVPTGVWFGRSGRLEQT